MFITKDPREHGQTGRQSTDSVQIVAGGKTSIPVGGGMFAPEGPVGMSEEQAGGTRRGVSLSGILRHKWTILLVTVLVAAPAITGIWMLIVPGYKAKAEVRVRPIIPRLVFKTEDNGTIPLYQSFMNTQVAIMRSPTLLQRVLDHENVQQTRWYKDPPKPLLKGQVFTPMERLRDSLSAKPRRGTELIDVSFTARSAKDAATIVNATLDQYIAYVSEMSNSTRDEIYRQLADQYKSLETEIEGRQKVLAKLRQELGTGVPEELVAMKRVSLEGAEGKYRGVYLEMSVAKWRHKRLEDTIAKIKAETKKKGEKNTRGDGNKAASANTPTSRPAEVQPKYHRDRDWRRMDVQVRTLKHQIESASRDFKPGHPTMVKLAGELKFAEAILALRQAQLDDDWKNRSRLLTLRAAPVPSGQPAINSQRPEAAYEAELQTVKAGLDLLKHRADLLLAEAKKQQSNFAETFQSAQMLEKENEALRHKRRLFEAVRSRLDAKEMERNVPGSIEVLTRAFAESQPSKDRRIVFTIMSLVAALGLGLGAAFLKASRSQAVYVPDDLPSHAIEGPFLGQLPIVTKIKEIDVEDNPMLAEGTRMVRTALLSRIDEGRGNAILISSAETGTGKSTFAVMLARSLAQSGKKTLLVDSDLRKRDLTRRFGLLDERGFIEALQLRSVDERGVFSTDTAGLDFMPAGQKNGGIELELTANGAFGALVKQAKSEYDIIILDSPPILPVADARILSRQVDGTVLVVRQETCRRNDVVDALACLGSSGGKLLGTVFLATPQRALYGHSYYYGSGDTQ